MKKDRSLKFQLNKFNKNGFVIEKIFNKSTLKSFKEKLLNKSAFCRNKTVLAFSFNKGGKFVNEIIV